MTFVTNVFLPLGKSDARALGMVELPIVVVPHPIGGQTEGYVKEKADKAIDEVISALTGETSLVGKT